MSIALNTDALYGGRPAKGPQQQRARERMTLAAYNEARHGRFLTVLWTVVAMVHIMIVVMALGLPSFVAELEANPSYLLGLLIWIAGDLVFLAFAPQIYNNYQATMDRLEGKTIRRR